MIDFIEKHAWGFFVILYGGYVILFVAFVVLAFLGYHDPQSLLATGAASFCLVIAGQRLTILFDRETQRRKRMMDQLPVNVSFIPGDDGNLTALVTRNDGTFTKLRVPDGYNPRDDKGRWLFENVLDEEALRTFDSLQKEMTYEEEDE